MSCVRLTLDLVHTRRFPPRGLIRAVDYSVFVYGIGHT